MVSYLVDTNVISELRKGERADAGVRAWFDTVEAGAIFLSVLVVGELRKGIENIRRRDARAALALEAWLGRLVAHHRARVLPITEEIAEVWGLLNFAEPLPVIDSLLAATAHVHDLTVISRNTHDFVRAGARVINPFAAVLRP